MSRSAKYVSAAFGHLLAVIARRAFASLSNRGYFFFFSASATFFATSLNASATAFPSSVG